MEQRRLEIVKDVEPKYYQLSPLKTEEHEWELFRRELSKDVLCAEIRARSFYGREEDIQRVVRTADELIKQLKGCEK